MTEYLVASVLMSERGVFLVRCPDSVSLEDCRRGRKAVVSLDYGIDTGEIVSAAAYDAALHGARLPGYRLDRFVQESDAARFAENAEMASRMTEDFGRLVRAEVPDMRIVASRLSFGRTRLFVSYVSERRKPALSKVFAEMRRLHGVSVNAWQAGPRDEVACMGALGPCGRVCCCSSWQKRFPSRVAPPHGVSPSSLNGVCGRYKCCWSFEDSGCDG